VRLTRLGIARHVPRAAYNAVTAARELRVLLDDGRYAERAAETGSHVRAETGAATASHLLTGLLERTHA
jgi:rhamnosyltransferase subunit B